MGFYDNVWHCMTMCDIVWQCMTFYDNAWHCMTMCDIVWQCMTFYDNVWHCMALYDNAWAMYDKNGWRGIACRGSESQVPSLIDQTLTPGYSRSLFYLRCFFQVPFCCWYFLTLSHFPIAFSLLLPCVPFRAPFLSIFSQIILLVTARLFLLSSACFLSRFASKVER